MRSISINAIVRHSTIRHSTMNQPNDLAEWSKIARSVCLTERYRAQIRETKVENARKIIATRVVRTLMGQFREYCDNFTKDSTQSTFAFAYECDDCREYFVSKKVWASIRSSLPEEFEIISIDSGFRIILSCALA